MPHSNHVERDLRALARAHLADVMQPELLRMRRMLIGEAERFPDLAQAWYQAGPKRSYAIFATWSQALDERGLLRVSDPMLVAQHFNWLILSIPVNMAIQVNDGSGASRFLTVSASALGRGRPPGDRLRRRCWGRRSAQRSSPPAR